MGRFMFSAVLGWFAAALSIALMWPQVWRSCVLRRTAGLSPTATWLGFALPVGWVEYGLLIDDPVQIYTNTVGAGAGIAVLVALLAARAELRQRRFGARAAVGAAVLLSATALTAGLASLPGGEHRTLASVLGMVLTVAVVLANVPQPLALLRDRRQDLSGVSGLRWVLASAANLSWAAYAYSLGQGAVLVCSLTGLACSLVVCTVLVSARRQRAVPPVAASAVASVPRAADQLAVAAA
ncbi:MULTISPECIES: SemiSWEET transporter [unclassified Actinoplanes]|uniref:SemiSWEET transporter n=1 Tax=unclassified Actinoplanes TaxID=2626549 RepID=UPI001E3A51F8|nr:MULTISPECIES: SemiSWEET transporter [unclassified Actinoplanes]